MKYKYSLTDTYFPDIREHFTAMISSLPKTKPNRSLIGKKAYKTFLKNGGARDSKGRFCKKQEIDWEWSCGNEICVGVHSSPKIQVDWKKIAEDLYKAYISTPYVLSDYSIENTKEFAKVFKKHGLIREGVEI